MKLQLDTVLTDLVRKPRTHRISQELGVKILVFILVFVLMQFAEFLILMPFIWDSMMDVFAEKLDAMGGSNLTFFQIHDEMNNVLMHPDLVKIMLFSTGAGTLTVLFWCRWIEGRKLRTMGFLKKDALKQYLIGLLAGFVTFSAIIGLDVLLGGLQFNGYKGDFSLGLLVLLLGFGVQGMSEEVLCRGYMLTSTLRHHNMWWAAGINAVLFGLMHFQNKGFTAFAMFNLTLFGIMISLYVLRTHNLWGACAFHSIWNFAQGNFYGLPVSGIDAGETVFSMSLKGSDFVNGGAFGLEAGIGTTIVLGIWIVILLFVPLPFAVNPESPAKEKAA